MFLCQVKPKNAQKEADQLKKDKPKSKWAKSGLVRIKNGLNQADPFALSQPQIPPLEAHMK